jgi:ElaB/YqjD/DUF883 family membrane-anchored ribosome-binding protein
MTSAYSSQSKNLTHASDDKSVDRGGMRELKKDADAVKQDLAHLKEDVVRASSHAASEAASALRAGADSANELACTARDSAKRGHEAMCSAVRKNPTASVLVALGAGVVVGRVLGRR